MKENIYGHAKRLPGMLSHLQKTNSIVEVSCGTGGRVCLPLAKHAYDIVGLALDEQSIQYGRGMFRGERLDPNALESVDFKKLAGTLGLAGRGTPGSVSR
jgi:hypothetical protein